MSYVAEPYLYVADQVLTALTGGAARETHRFFAGANAFSFERPAASVLTDSVRVIGQAAGAFFSFTLGTDFAIGGDGLLRFRAGNDPGTPANGATWPDEATEFYVSYYHAQSFQAPLTDRNVGSLTRTLGEAFARELAVLRTQLELVYRSGFVDTAEGSALDMVVALLGLTRKTREYASGTVRFTRDTPAPADVFIPSGTKVSTALPPPKAPASPATPASPPGSSGSPPTSSSGAAAAKSVSFVTTEDRTLRRGQLSVEVPVRAEIKGASGVVAAGSITVVNQPVLGVSGVLNEAGTVFGAAGESDAELRRRARTLAERAGRATPRALLNALTELPAIKANDVSVTEDLHATPGVVSVSVAAEPSPQLAADVHDAILQTRAAGIRVVTNLDSFLPQIPVATSATGTLRDTSPPGPPSSPPASGPGFRLPLQATVVVFPEDPRISGSPKAALQQAVAASVVADVEASTVGGVIIYNRLSANLMGIPGVYDAVLDISPKGAAGVGSRHNIAVPGPPDPRRAVIDPSDVKVIFAGAPLFFDFDLAVTPIGGASLDDIRKEVLDQLAAYFATDLPASGRVESTALLARLTASTKFRIDAADLTWTAEFTKAGLVIRNQGGATPTSVPEGDQPILRNVTVTAKPAP